MIEITNTEVVGWEHAIRGMRNPMNSWDKSDSGWCGEIDCGNCKGVDGGCDNETTHNYNVGQNDLDLMKRLVKAGTDHSKFMRMITVYADINAPLYWWKEYDTYKVGTVANSCSTMHKIQAKEFTTDDFSHDNLYDDSLSAYNPTHILNYVIDGLNYWRARYLQTKNKDDWWQMIQLLPSSYNQKRTVELNYAVLRNMYHSRKNHKLDEWHKLCDWIESLPYAELITMEG